MRKLVAVLLVLSGLWLGVELIAPVVAEGRIEAQALERSRGATTVSADVRSFPLVTGVMVTGDIRHLSVTLEEVVRRRLSWAQVRFDLEGITLDRSELLRREVEVTDIESGTVTAELTSDEIRTVLGIAEALGLPEMQLGVSGDALRLRRPGGAIFDIPLPDDLFPCEPAASVDGEAIVLSCTFTEAPSILTRAARETDI